MITTITRRVVKRCPFVDETDIGELTVEIPGDAPELHDLGRQVDQFGNAKVSHEDYTRQIATLVPGAVVTTRWETGPWTVECREGPEG